MSADEEKIPSPVHDDNDAVDKQSEGVKKENDIESFTITQRCRHRVAWAESVRRNFDLMLPVDTDDGNTKDETGNGDDLSLTRLLGGEYNAWTWCTDFQNCTNKKHRICHTVKGLDTGLTMYKERRDCLVDSEDKLALAEAELLASTSVMTASEQDLIAAEQQVVEDEKRLEDAEKEWSVAEEQNKKAQEHDENEHDSRKLILQLSRKIVDRCRDIVDRCHTLVDRCHDTVKNKRALVDHCHDMFSFRRYLLEHECQTLCHISSILLHYHVKARNNLEELASGNYKTLYSPAMGASAEKENPKRLKLDPTRFTIIPHSPVGAHAILKKCEHLQIPPDTLGVEDQSLQGHEFRSFLQDLLQKCSTSEIKSYQPNDHIIFNMDIEKMVNVILDWEPGMTVPEGEYIRLSGITQGMQGTHPILLAIIRRIIVIFDLEKQTTHTQFVPETEGKSKRFMNEMSGALLEHLLATVTPFVDVSIEIKPLSHKDKKFAHLVTAGEKQCIGHCSQILLDNNLQFGAGLGRNGKVHGVVLTLISIEIVEVELVGVGTDDVQVVVRKSGHLPLFEKDTSRHLLRLQREKDQNAALKALQWAKDEDKDPPKGFHALWWVLMLKNNPKPVEDFQFVVEGIDDLKLGKYLASGEFTNIYCGDGGDQMKGVIVKIPRSVVGVEILQHELAVLKHLQYHEALPSLCDDSDTLKRLNLTKGCESAHIDCLPLRTNVGVNALDAMNASTNRDDMLLIIIDTMKNVLSHVHQKQVVHLDIKPCHIIVSTEQVVHVQLVDWGFSHRPGEGLIHYRGCPPYSHSTLLQNSKQHKFLPEAKHDYAALAFTVAHLAHFSNTMPWPNCFNIGLSQAVLKERYEIATKIISGCSLIGGDLKKELIGYMAPEKQFPILEQIDCD